MIQYHKYQIYKVCGCLCKSINMYWKKASLFITTAKAVEILGVKYRRARAVLLSMVESGWLKKEGASRSTVYVRNTEER